MSIGQRYASPGTRVSSEIDTVHLLPQWASLNKVVLDLLDQYQPALAVKRLGTGIDLAPGLPLSWADRAQLELGVGRVLSHTVKHSRRGGLIVCRTAVEGDWVSLTIGSDGEHPSANEVAALRGRGSQPARERGTEADLSRAQAIITAHGGRIEIDTSHDYGSWFVMRLPAIARENERLVAALADLQRGRSDLVVEMSYALRTPLHVIMGYTDLLIEGSFGQLNRNQLDALRRLEAGARELLDAINGVVDLRALDASHAPLELRQGQLPDLVRGCCQIVVDVLACDVGQVWVWQPATDVYVSVAACGATRPFEAPPHDARLPRTRVVQLLARRGRGGATTVEARELFAPPAAYRHGLSRCLLAPLQRNGTNLGLLVAGVRAANTFSSEQMQVAEGIGDLAALALENAWLAEELVQAERFTSELVASLSHRFRVPLDVIFGYAELLVEGQFGSLTPEQAGVIRQLGDSGMELLKTIDRLGEVSRRN
jgi:signal transduction histidine kinase